MQQARKIVRWTESVAHQLVPQRLRDLGKNEKFLEKVIAEHPELLGLESRRSGIYGPLAYFRQVSLRTPAGREIYPDIVFLAASGHFIVVEVKLGDNFELKDRDVIAQIIDYASSFASLDEKQLLGLFDKGLQPRGTWFEFVSDTFPDEEHPDELANLIRERIASGEINLVIACDQVPAALPEIVKGIATQQSTSFSLDLVEITPFCAVGSSSEILFIPSNRLSTEIVARTTVTVTYQGTPPDVSVETTPIDEIVQNTQIAKTKISTARVWPPGEVEKVVRGVGDPLEVQLLEFCKQYSSGGEFVSPAVKSNATFGFYVIGRKSDGKKAKNMLFYLTHGWNAAYLNLAVVRPLVDEEIFIEFLRRLVNYFGHQFDTSAPAPRMDKTILAAGTAEFQQLVLWFQEQVNLRFISS